MTRVESESPDESFFNDLSQQGPDANNPNGQEAQADSASRPKRIACVLCRKRKLRCDGARPSCATCRRLSHDCAYDEVRKKSGPKRGYVKLLEQRLQQVETLLKNQDPTDSSNNAATRQDSTSAYVANTIQQSLPNSGDYLNTSDRTQGAAQESRTPGVEPFQNTGASGNNGEQDFSWEMIGLGLEEPLPPQDVMDDLYHIYFTKIHPSIPLIHRPRFLAALNLAPHMRPPVCLRYIMWTLAATVTDKYEALREHFYQRARKYAQMDEMKGHGESTITLAHCQFWILTCTYEFKHMYFPRAWLSAGRAVRLGQMMQLHRLDGVGLDVKQCLPPPKDWTEREERRRTFWMSFCLDRYASIGTGWPMTIDEKDIMTNLPASEDAFDKSKPMPTGSLDQVLNPNGAANLQPLGGIVLTAAMFGRNLLHLHRPGPDDNDDDINGGFWTRHRQIEQILLQTSLGLPDHLRLPAGLVDPNVVFANMCIHTSAICLHQAAIFKADKYRLPVHVSNESKIRCVTAAAEIASIMRMISHMDLSVMNPFISFCVYVAARVFVQYLKTRPNDQQMNSSLQFLLQAMQALRRKNPLTESFLVQLDLDLESAGILNMQQKPYLPLSTGVSQPTQPMQGLSDSVGNHFQHAVDTSTDVRCSPLVVIRESQNPSAAINTFGNSNGAAGAATAAHQFTNNTPGPPFHVSNVNNVDMNAQTPGFLQSQSRSTSSQDFVPAGFAIPDGNEMDVSGDRSVDQPSPATMSSQSRGGSTSHSSYSPGQQNEHHLPYRASPKMPLSQMRAPSGGAGAATAFPSFASSSEMYTNTFSTSGDMNDDGFQQEFLVGNEWEYTALNTGTGMTPMADSSAWDSMLESVTMGWGSVGPPSSHHAPGST
ncbi:binuclear zinc transcription factor [Cucurbitaria berberidis CBS 394.84]|uniref:Binuclear zinc transcription factor n=1 Tax=Cucurbitaria berberidis CBS 394.84 TaxID=1168544 RepID=A0A9P4G8H2_9PLEO|nr:binuclear zinc transcription factor [Cucurbitaria berberidis CBS 394.84]KAF1840851.1 binuclear zinc transcription factor [Cucurbitaria berberidis CBS 394.84]